MRAWFLSNYSSNLTFSKSYTVPQPKPNEILINVKASCVNPIDYKILEPVMQSVFPLHFPTVLGFEAAGVVVKLGAHTSGRFKLGDEVWVDLGVQHLGGYGDYVDAPEQMVGAKPKSLTFEEAATLPLVGLTALQGFEKANALQPLKGKTVLVLGGSGGVGFVALQLAKRHYGAARVITTTSAANAEFVRGLGADEVIDYHTSNWWEVVENGTVDFVYDTVGQAGTGLRATPKLTLSGSGVFLTIAHKGPLVGLDPNPPPNVVQIYHKLLEVPGDLDRLRALVDCGTLKPHIQRTYPLADLPSAWAASRAGHVVGKLAITHAGEALHV